MPSRLATSLTVKLCGGNSFFNTASLLSGEYRVTHSSLALCSINDDLIRVTTSLTQGAITNIIDEAQQAVNQRDRRQVDYPRLVDDLQKIQQGILDAINAERREPRSLPPVDGDYL